MMKPIYLFPLFLVALIVPSSWLYGQNSKIVYGNFVYQNEVYQYKCEKNSSEIYQFSISTLEPASQWSGFKVEDVDFALDYITKTYPARTPQSDSLVRVLGAIKSVLNQQAVWTVQVSYVDSLIKQVKGVEEKDTNWQKLGISPLLAAYKGFLTTNKSKNQSKVKITSGLEVEVFRTNFRNALAEVAVSEELPSVEEANDLANQVYYSILARIEFTDDEPVTAHVLLKKKYVDVVFMVPAVQLDPNKPKRKIKKEIRKGTGHETLVPVTVRCEITRVSLEFDEGTLKNILIDVIPSVKEYNDQFQNTTIRFRNNMPISISSKFDPDKFKKHHILISNSRELQQNLLVLARTKYPGYRFNDSRVKTYSDNQANIVLSEILDLQIILENDKEDYSPANCVVELTPTKPVMELKKEKRSKILTVVGFTDFVGLNSDNPNGLVQFEAYKRINISTLNIKGFFGIQLLKQGASYTGFLNYLRPRFAWNKIEENNKYLYFNASQIDSTRTLDSGQLAFKYNPLKVFQYRIFSLQLDLNLFTWNLPNKKLGFGVNAFVNYGNTLIADSLSFENGNFSNLGTRNTRNMGTAMTGLDLYCDIKSDSRYGFSAGWNPGYIKVWEHNFLPDPRYRRLIMRYYVNAFIKTNDNSKLFFRFSVQHTHKDYRNHYYQAQLGYIIDIFSSSGSAGNHVTTPPRP
ncbi:MAG TPA: hypothetical protein DIW47_08005 [Bacteroidetes bacterium]|nr:hypothetical protein [Bacteroidota bacterium]